MAGQMYAQPRAWNYSLSLHYTFPPTTGIIQFNLSARHDFNNFTVPISTATGVFTSYVANGQERSLDGLVSVFNDGLMSEVKGFLIAENCHAWGVVNIIPN